MASDDTTLKETSADSADRWARLITEYFAISDRWEFASFARYLSHDIEFRFANNAPIAGLEAMLEFAAQYRESVKSVDHKLISLYADINQRVVVAEMEVQYVKLDDATSTYPAAVILSFNPDDLIEGYRVYVDLSELH